MEAAAQGQPLVKRVSLLSGLLLSILLLLLSSALLLILLLRRRRRARRRRESSLGKSDAVPPIYRLDTPLLLQRESLGRDCELGETPRWASQRYPSTPTTSHCKMFTSPGNLLQPLLTSPSSITSNVSSIDSFIDLTGQADAFAEPCLPTEEEQSMMMTASPRLGGGSVPHLATRRRSSSARPAPPPRPPRSARSLGHLHNAKEEEHLEGEKGRGKEGRRRRKTAPARCLQNIYCLYYYDLKGVGYEEEEEERMMMTMGNVGNKNHFSGARVVILCLSATKDASTLNQRPSTYKI